LSRIVVVVAMVMKFVVARALTGKYPPKIMVASKYERRAGLKPFGETKGLFEGVRSFRSSKGWGLG